MSFGRAVISRAVFRPKVEGFSFVDRSGQLHRVRRRHLPRGRGRGLRQSREGSLRRGDIGLRVPRHARDRHGVATADMGHVARAERRVWFEANHFLRRPDGSSSRNPWRISRGIQQLAGAARVRRAEVAAQEQTSIFHRTQAEGARMKKNPRAGAPRAAWLVQSGALLRVAPCVISPSSARFAAHSQTRV